VEGLDDSVKLAARQLAISRLRLVELMTLLPEDHALLVAERRLAVERVAELRRTVQATVPALDRQRVAASVAALNMPETKEEAVEALAWALLYETIAFNPTPELD
jgi:hypothetical protein